jgi:hypothetical protein
MIYFPDERDRDRFQEYRTLTSMGMSHYMACKQTHLTTQKVMWYIELFRDEMNYSMPYTKEIAGVEEMAMRMNDTWQDPAPIVNQVEPVDRSTPDEIRQFYQNLRTTGRMTTEKLNPLKLSA